MSLSARRAWIEINHQSDARRSERSLSARRAWIEIAGTAVHHPGNAVALRKESVDRNDIAELTAHLPLVSLSARRAWIEISAAKYR